MSRICIHKDGENSSMFCVGNPEFSSIDDVIVSLFDSGSFHGKGIWTRVSLRQTETSDLKNNVP